MLGVKRFETRLSPPNGNMRPDGVRGLPGARVNRGDRILIASTKRVAFRHGASIPGVCHVDRKAPSRSDGGYWAMYLPPSWDLGIEHRLPLGCILGSVTVTDAYPMESTWPARGSHPEGVVYAGANYDLTVWRSGDEQGEPITDQRPLGDWTPGRWAWALADPVPTTTRCPHPVCDGEGTVPSAKGWPRDACPFCRYDGKCEPVPVVGKQGVWRWDGTVRS
jgi:hypothetical protein